MATEFNERDLAAKKLNADCVYQDVAMVGKNESNAPGNELEENAREVTATTTDAKLECRICYEADEIENLIQPCQCSGTMLYAHRSCLMQEICMGRKKCAVCNHQYQPEVAQNEHDMEGGTRFIRRVRYTARILCIVWIVSFILSIGLIIWGSMWIGTKEPNVGLYSNHTTMLVAERTLTTHNYNAEIYTNIDVALNYKSMEVWYADQSYHFGFSGIIERNDVAVAMWTGRFSVDQIPSVPIVLHSSINVIGGVLRGLSSRLVAGIYLLTIGTFITIIDSIILAWILY